MLNFIFFGYKAFFQSTIPLPRNVQLRTIFAFADGVNNLEDYGASAGLDLSQILARRGILQGACAQAEASYAAFTSTGNAGGQLKALDAIAALKMKLNDHAAAVEMLKKAMDLSKVASRTLLPDVNRKMCADLASYEEGPDHS